MALGVKPAFSKVPAQTPLHTQNGERTETLQKLPRPITAEGCDACATL